LHWLPLSLVVLLRMYFPRNWEFDSALSKLWNFGGVWTPQTPPPPRYATVPYNVGHLVTGLDFLWGGVQKIQLRTEDRENGDLGVVAP
jgi:hypothetical protein